MASDKEALCLRGIIASFVIRCEFLQSLFRYIVETCIFKHLFCPFCIYFAVADIVLFYTDFSYCTTSLFCHAAITECRIHKFFEISDKLGAIMDLQIGSRISQ